MSFNFHQNRTNGSLRTKIGKLTFETFLVATYLKKIEVVEIMRKIKEIVSKFEEDFKNVF